VAIAITSVKYEHNYVTLTFDKGIWRGGFGGVTPAQSTDFQIVYTDNSDTGSSAASILDITGIGNGALGGGATSVRIWIGTTGIPVGARCTVHAASAITDTLTINNSIYYRIIKINLTTNSTDTLAVTKDDKEYQINIALANATASKNTAALIQTAIRALGTIGKIYYGGELNLTTITCTAGGNWDTAAIATGEIVPLLMGGLATFEIKPASGSSISDSTNIHYLPASATSGVYNLNPFKYVYVTKGGSDSNSGLTARLPKLTYAGGCGASAAGKNKIIVGIGVYGENYNASSTTNLLHILGDTTDTITNSNSGVSGIVQYTMSSYSNQGTAYVEWNNLTSRSTSGYFHRFGSTSIQAWGTYLKNCVFKDDAAGGGLYYSSSNSTGGLTWLVDCSTNNANTITINLGQDSGEYVTAYVTDCDFLTNSANVKFFGAAAGCYANIRNTKFSSVKLFDTTVRCNLDDIIWNSAFKPLTTSIFYKDFVVPMMYTTYNNLTNVSTTQDYYNFWNSTAACTYTTGYKANYNTNTHMYRLQEDNKIYINGINSDSTKYLMVPTGIFIKDGGTHNSKYVWDFLCSKVNTTGIYRYWHKLNVNNSTTYTLTYDYLFNFTTTAAKTVKIEIVKGRSLAESTAVATTSLLASDKTQNQWYDDATLQFTTDATNDEYYLSILLPTAVSTNNEFKFVNKGIA